MKQEVEAHIEDKNWVIVHKSKVPANRKILPAVWAMRRKRDIATRTVYKWKARLNLHGGKQVLKTTKQSVRAKASRQSVEPAPHAKVGRKIGLPAKYF